MVGYESLFAKTRRNKYKSYNHQVILMPLNRTYTKRGINATAYIANISFHIFQFAKYVGISPHS